MASKSRKWPVQTPAVRSRRAWKALQKRINTFETKYNVCIGTVAYVAADKEFQYAGTSGIVSVLKGVEQQVANAMPRALSSRIGVGSSAPSSSSSTIAAAAPAGNPDPSIQENMVPMSALLALPTEELTNDQLRTVIRAIVMGPGQTPKFAWQKAKPSYWPQHIPFCSPNKPIDEDTNKFTKPVLIEIVDHLKKHLTEVSKGTNDSDPQQIHSTRGDKRKQIPEAEGKDNSEPKKMKYAKKPSVKQLMQSLAKTKEDQQLKRELMQLDEAVFQPLFSPSPQQVEDFGARNTRFPSAFYKDGDPHFAFNATGDGNCLFHSFARLMYGSEENSHLLCLFCAYKAAMEFDKVVELILLYLGDGTNRADITDVQSYLQEVCDLTKLQNFTPDDPTPELLMEYCMYDAIRDTLTPNAYAGIWQVQLLAVALDQHVAMFTEHDERDVSEYDNYVPFDGLSHNRDTSLCVLLCKTTDASSIKNHFVPVVKGKSYGRRKAKKTMAKGNAISIYTYLGDQCILRKLGLCSCVKSGRRGIDMIQCGRCLCWQHCQCAGVAAKVFQKDPYICCDINDVEATKKVVVAWPKGKKMVMVKLADIMSTNPNCGLNDAIVDFYVRVIEEESPNAMDGIYVFSSTEGLLVQNSNSRSRKRAIPLVQAYIFPVKPTDDWHWVAVCFLLENQRCHYFVMDSLHKRQWRSLIKKTHVYLSTLVPNLPPLEGTGIECSVAAQKNNDCGLMMLQNIQEVVKMMPLKTPTKLVIPSPLSGDQMRMTVRRLLHQKAEL